MSIHQHPAQFRNNIAALDPTNQAQMDLAIRLALGALLPPPVNARRGADAKDCELAIEAIERVTALYTDFVLQVLKEINANVPVTDRKVDLNDFLAAVTDVKNDAVGVLQMTADIANGV